MLDDEYKTFPFAEANGINSAQSSCFGAVFGAKQPKNCDKTVDNPEVLKSNLMGLKPDRSGNLSVRLLKQTAINEADSNN